MSDEPELFTITRLSSLYKRDRRTIEHLLEGIAPAVVVKRGGKVFRKWARADVHERLSAPTATDSLRAAFEELHGIRAEIRRTKRARRSGELLDVPSVQHEVGMRISQCRSAALNLVAKTAPQIMSAAASSNARKKVRAIVKAELKQIRDDLLSPFSWERP
jgi:hypothetical protein